MGRGGGHCPAMSPLAAVEGLDWPAQVRGYFYP